MGKSYGKGAIDGLRHGNPWLRVRGRGAFRNDEFYNGKFYEHLISSTIVE